MGDVSFSDRKVDAAKVHRRDDIYQGNVFNFVNEEITLDGHDSAVERQVIAHPGAVVIVAVRGEGSDAEVLLQSQYRHPIRSVLWEVPAGLLDHGGEDPLEAAKRELAEEAGLEAASWQVLVDLFSSAGALDESVRVFLAQELKESDLEYERLDEEADMVPLWVPLEEACDAALAGRLHNSATVAGLLAASRLLRSGRQGRSPEETWLR